jgi:hypothetical protein
LSHMSNTKPMICMRENLLNCINEAFLLVTHYSLWIGVALSVVRNHSHELVHSTSNMAIATGKMQSLGSIPTNVIKTPLYLVFMWHP